MLEVRPQGRGVARRRGQPAAGFLDARYNVASVLLDSGDYARAQEELEKVLAGAPTDLAARVALGVALRGRGQLDRARAAWVDVVERAPRRSAARADALFAIAVLEADFVRDEKKAVAALDRTRIIRPS